MAEEQSWVQTTGKEKINWKTRYYGTYSDFEEENRVHSFCYPLFHNENEGVEGTEDWDSYPYKPNLVGEGALILERVFAKLGYDKKLIDSWGILQAAKGIAEHILLEITSMEFSFSADLHPYTGNVKKNEGLYNLNGLHIEPGKGYSIPFRAYEQKFGKHEDHTRGFDRTAPDANKLWTELNRKWNERAKQLQKHSAEFKDAIIDEVKSTAKFLLEYEHRLAAEKVNVKT